MSSEIVTAGDYCALVRVQTLRDALNLRASHPTDTALALRIAEAAQRIEGLIRFALPEYTWEYETETPGQAILLRGLFPLAGRPSVQVSDWDGGTVPVQVRVTASGRLARISPVAGSTWYGLAVPFRVRVVRGVAAEDLPEDLRAAIVTQVEQYLDGFNMAGDNAILRVCSRYGWTGF